MPSLIRLVLVRYLCALLSRWLFRFFHKVNKNTVSIFLLGSGFVASPDSPFFVLLWRNIDQVFIFVVAVF